MNYEIEKLAETAVLGESIATTNAENIFGEVWQRVLSKGVTGKMIGLYHKYDSDFSGGFTFTAGTEVKPGTPGSVKIPDGEYLKFHCANREEVGAVWGFVWNEVKSRLYTFDFEVYNADGTADVYIAADLAFSPCGLDCRTCPEYEKSCPGCRKVSGVPMWAAQIGMEVCPQFKCPVTDKGHYSCGACEKLPCESYYELKDPATSDEEHLKGVQIRVSNLRGKS